MENVLECLMMVVESPWQCLGRGSQCCSLCNSQEIGRGSHSGALQEEEGEEGDGGAGNAEHPAALDKDGL